MKRFFFQSKKTPSPQLGADGRQFFFLHIPKTAGISFAAFLCSHFEQTEILQGSYWEVIRKRPISELSTYRLITGHIGYDLVFHLKNPFVITILRHPVDRLCSLYEYLNQVFDREPNTIASDPDINALNQLWKIAVRRSLPEFLESTEAPVLAALLQNPQARQLAQATPYLLTDLSDEQLFQLAKSRLSKIEVVGTADSFANTVNVTCRKTGWGLPEDFSRYNLNITEKRPVRDLLDKSLRQKIERMCAVDTELYHLAQKRLLDDLRE
ncbi:MAG: sulfotransferase family 2 domain-containing protein [Acidobacteriota bacterium]|nr:sulfotransferase family 2 domain-containing protein [Acidobacteriota bacterium]